MAVKGCKRRPRDLSGGVRGSVLRRQIHRKAGGFEGFRMAAVEVHARRLAVANFPNVADRLDVRDLGDRVLAAYTSTSTSNASHCCSPVRTAYSTARRAISTFSWDIEVEYPPRSDRVAPKDRCGKRSAPGTHRDGGS